MKEILNKILKTVKFVKPPTMAPLKKEKVVFNM